MKRLTILSLLSLIISLGNAQTVGVQQQSKDFRHKGFYLSLGGGLNYGSILTKTGNQYDTKYKGLGPIIDIKIGGAIKENLILHATMTSKVISSPKISYSANSANIFISENSSSINAEMIGAGLTYYVMPSNIFFSGSLGSGSLPGIDRAFSMQIKIGKEWWVSKKWGLGIALSYEKTKFTDAPYGIEQSLNSNNFAILFNATLN